MLFAYLDPHHTHNGTNRYVIHSFPDYSIAYIVVLGTRSGSSKLHQHAVCMACIYVYKLNLGGPDNYFRGTKSVWSPQTEFEGTKE